MLLCVEIVAFRTVRGEGFWWKLCTSLLLSTSGCVALLPMFITQTWTFKEAEAICMQWTVEKLQTMDIGIIEDNANRHLFPAHPNNVTALFISVICFLVWYFLSPHNVKHNSAVAENLDRTFGSFFAVEVVANLIVSATSLGENCNSSPTIHQISVAVGILTLFGLSILGTNILCHRYLLAKARVMVNLLNDDNDSAEAWLEWLEYSFKWEIRSLLFVVLGAPLQFIYPPAAKFVVLGGAFCVIFMDTTFSAIVTALYLRPIFKVLHGPGTSGNIAGYRSMMKTKWMTLIGSTFAVVSSTALYVNAICWSLSDLGDPFWSNPHLQPYVTGVNVDSIINDLSMILVCGVLKNVSCKSLGTFLTVPTSRHPVMPS